MHEPKNTANVVVEHDGGVTIITINRPHKKNAVNTATSRLLFKAFQDFEADVSQKVCVFAGAGGTFCAGFDLEETSRQDNGGQAASSNPLADLWNFESQHRGPMGPSRMTFSKPVIVAVSGYAVAGGLELSLLGDMRVVEEDAVFGVFCRRFGVPLIDGGTVRLQAVVGLGRAMDMIITGRAVRAEEALTMGLANRVVPRGQALSESIKLAKSLLGFPQECMNVDRMNAYHAAYTANSFSDALKHEFVNGAQVVGRESVPGAKQFVAGKGRHGSFGGSKL